MSSDLLKNAASISHCKQKHMNKYYQNKTCPAKTSHNKELHISPCIQQQMMQEWDPVIQPIFQGANITNCTFNIEINTMPPRIRRRLVIEDDSDTE